MLTKLNHLLRSRRIVGQGLVDAEARATDADVLLPHLVDTFPDVLFAYPCLVQSPCWLEARAFALQSEWHNDLLHVVGLQVET